LPGVRGQADERRRSGTLGPVVTSQFGGEIFGWDIDQNGSDGVLTETVLGNTGLVLNAIETFDQTTGKITKVVRKTVRSNADVEPVADAIAGSDVGIIDVAHNYPSRGFIRDDHFAVMNPVSSDRITGKSAPRNPTGLVPSFVTNNQSSSSELMMGFIENKRHVDVPVYYTYDASHNRWGRREGFPHSQLFDIGFPLYAAVDSQTNVAVTGYLGRPRYNPHESPRFDMIDAATGKLMRTFQGLGLGFINGMAIDSTSGTMCTTTSKDMDVEFYDLSTRKGIAVQIPTLYGGGPLTQGAAVAADPINHLCLVAQLNSTFDPLGGSTVIVYDEHGNLIEYINGFSFLDPFSVVVPHLAVNAVNRTGYVNGPGQNQLQEFSY